MDSASFQRSVGSSDCADRGADLSRAYVQTDCEGPSVCLTLSIMPSTRSSGDAYVHRNEIPPYPDLHPIKMHRNWHKEREKKGWPTIWRRLDHPQWLPGEGAAHNRKDAFVYICDATEKGMKESLELGAKMESPGQGDKAIADYGSFGLIDGQALFARASTGTGSADNDVIQVWVNGSSALASDFKSKLDSLVDTLIGQKDDIIDTNRTAFERCDRAKNIDNCPRAYSFATSFETPRASHGPHVNMKVKDDWGSDPWLAFRKDLLEIAGFNMGPEDLLKNMQDHADTFNTPRVGTYDNYAFTAFQLNIAPAIKYAILQKLIEFIGKFGGSHIDTRDSPGGFTCMFGLSRLPSRYCPGYIILLSIGVHVRLERYRAVYFSGLQWHVGTQPTPPPGVNPEVDALRLTMVAYPNIATFEGGYPSFLASLPRALEIPSGQYIDRGEFRVGPEMTGTAEMLSPSIQHINHSTYARDGRSIFDHKSHMAFFVYSLIYVLIFFLSQLPDDYRIEVDVERICEAITFLNEKGQREAVPDWVLGPGKRTNGILKDQTDLRARVAKRWQEHVRRYSSVLPVLQVHGALNTDSGITSPSDLFTKNASAALKSASLKARKTASNNGGSNRTNSGAARSSSIPVRGGRSRTTRRSSTRKRPYPRKPQSDPESDTEYNRGRSTNRVGRGFNRRSGARARSVTAVSDHDIEVLELRKLHSEMVESGASKWAAVSVEGSSAGIRCLRGLDEDYLQRYLISRIEDARKMEGARYTDVRWRTIDESISVLKQGDSSISAGLSLACIVHKLHDLEATASSTMISSILNHQKIMLYNDMAVQWLEKMANDHSRIASQSSSFPSHWIQSVAYRFYGVVDKTEPSLEIQAPSELQHLPNCTSPYTWKISQPDKIHRARRGSDLFVVEQVLKVLQHWLGFDTLSRARAYFVSHVTLAAGEDILLLDVMWDAYCFIQRDVTGKVSGELKPSHFNELKSHLRKHPISDSRSLHRSILQSIGDVFRSAEGETAWTSDKDISMSLSDSSSVPRTDRLEMVVEISEHSKRRHEEDGPASGASLKRPKLVRNTISSSAIDNGHRKLLKFIDDTYDAKFGSGTVDTDLKIRVMDAQDEFLPFRENAPSRSKVLEPDGPYSPDFLKTTFGLFSILIWRGITFGCRAVLDHPTNRFRSLEEWNTFVEENSRQKPTYFCKKNIYTTPISGRCINLASDYWEAANLEAHNWTSLVDSPGLSYQKLFDFFIKEKDTLPDANLRVGGRYPYHLQDGSFPQIGRLIAHLLAADCAYALIPCPPSARVLGSMICTLDMGAMNGMKKLSLIKSKERIRDYSIEEIQTAFEAAHDFLSANIPPDQQIVIGFNSFIVEHSMCKYSKLHKHPR